MPGPCGTCALCRKQAESQNSHLLPAAIYKIARQDEKANPNPVRIDDDRVVQSSREKRCHLLCRDCEQQLDKGGEKWVLARCWQRGGRFPLRDTVEAAVLLQKHPKMSLYDVTAADVDGDQLMHFAVGVLWKKSVWPRKKTSWPDKKFSPAKKIVQADTDIDLGTYAEPLRAYLRGGPFPAMVCVILWLTRAGSKFECIAWEPTSSRGVGGARAYRFGIPGMQFQLFLGRQAAESEIFGLANRRVLIVDQDDLTLNMLRILTPKDGWPKLR